MWVTLRWLFSKSKSSTVFWQHFLGLLNTWELYILIVLCQTSSRWSNGKDERRLNSVSFPHLVPPCSFADLRDQGSKRQALLGNQPPPFPSPKKDQSRYAWSKIYAHYMVIVKREYKIFHIATAETQTFTSYEKKMFWLIGKLGHFDCPERSSCMKNQNILLFREHTFDGLGVSQGKVAHRGIRCLTEGWREEKWMSVSLQGVPMWTCPRVEKRSTHHFMYICWVRCSALEA